jgi:hypothetical protein
MIHVVLSAVVSSLNEYIRNELNLQEDVVILTNAVDLSGNLNSQIDNKLCVFLQNLDEERVIRNGGYQNYLGSNPPKHFNLHVVLIFMLTLSFYLNFKVMNRIQNDFM